MSKLSPNFERSEFEKSGQMPDECVPLFAEFCHEVLEPIRDHFGKPVRVTSGYRSPERNAAIGGSKTSQHVATPSHCAADIQIVGHDIVEAFDWIRLHSMLPFDQAILEYGQITESQGDDCIHLSYAIQPRRMAMVGATNGRTSYVRVEVG